MQTPHITDQQRHDLEAALVAAMLLLYQGSMRDALTALKRYGNPVVPPAAAADIRQKAKEHAQLVQAGINQRMDMAAEQDDSEAAIAQAKTEIAQYNDDVLMPFMVSYSQHQGLFDSYRTTPDPKNPDRSMLDTSLWVWSQRTAFQDNCTDAEAAGPAPWGDLVALAGGEPPTHRNCQCILEPVDQSTTL